MTAILDAALSYAARGWPVLPLHTIRDGLCGCGNPACRTPGKHPISRLAPLGLHGASADPAIVRQWWAVAPDANVGIRTGLASGLAVVDIDTKDDGQATLGALVASHGPIPDTIEAITGSGGRHILFVCPPDGFPSSTGTFGPGTDSRGDGGYIVAAPSLHLSGRRYEWETSSHPDDGVVLAEAPGWLLAIARTRRERLTVADDDRPLLAPETVAELRGALGYLDADDRSTWVDVALALKWGAPARQAFGIWTDWSRLSPKYDPTVQRQTWDGLKPAGDITVASIIYRAQQLGWVRPGAALAPDRDAPTPQRRFKLVPASALAHILPPGWLLRGCLVRGGINMVTGDPGAGKTHSALGWAVSVACGSSWGHLTPSATGAVVYLAGEDVPGLLHRLRAWGEYLGPDVPSPADRIHVVGPPDGALSAAIPFPPALDDPAECLALAAEIRRVREETPGAAPIALLVVDVLLDLFSSTDDSANAAVRRMLATLKRHILPACGDGVTVVLCAHITKTASERGDFRPLGGAAFTGALDFGVGVAHLEEAPKDDPRRQLVCFKPRGSRPPPPMDVRLTEIDIPRATMPSLTDEDAADAFPTAAIMLPLNPDEQAAAAKVYSFTCPPGPPAPSEWESLVTSLADAVAISSDPDGATGSEWLEQWMALTPGPPRRSRQRFYQWARELADEDSIATGGTVKRPRYRLSANAAACLYGANGPSAAESAA